MNRSQILSALETDQAFTLMMADGKEYEIPHPDYLSLSPKGTFVTLYDDEENFFCTPLANHDWVTLLGV